MFVVDSKQFDPRRHSPKGRQSLPRRDYPLPVAVTEALDIAAVLLVVRFRHQKPWLHIPENFVRWVEISQTRHCVDYEFAVAAKEICVVGERMMGRKNSKGKWNRAEQSVRF